MKIMHSRWRSPKSQLGGPCLPFPPLSFFVPSLSALPLLPLLSLSTSSLFPLPCLPLVVGPPKIHLEGLGSAVSSPSGVWGRAPAEIEFGAFLRSKVESDAS